MDRKPEMGERCKKWEREKHAGRSRKETSERKLDEKFMFLCLAGFQSFKSGVHEFMIRVTATRGDAWCSPFHCKWKRNMRTQKILTACVRENDRVTPEFVCMHMRWRLVQVPQDKRDLSKAVLWNAWS